MKKLTIPQNSGIGSFYETLKSYRLNEKIFFEKLSSLAFRFNIMSLYRRKLSQEVNGGDETLLGNILP